VGAPGSVDKEMLETLYQTFCLLWDVGNPFTVKKPKSEHFNLWVAT